MKIRSAIGSLILGAALAASFTLAAPAEAGVRIGVHVGIARPALRREVAAVRPSSHHVWVAGYWHWPEGGREWAWVGGAWTLPPHAHATWVGPRYVRRDGEWVYTSGYWR
ncbi:MAG: hypothetical protein ABI609_05650 [Acidobacteriota bacterium]